MTARERAAWSWTEQLRRGGSTPWTAWLSDPQAGSQAGSQSGSRADPPAGWSAPGAAQLELVRRLATAAAEGGPTGPAFTRLADLVLSRSGPGRGLAQQPLAWPTDEATPGRRFGAPPVDPADVPVDELVRLAVGTLTELLLAGPPVVEPAQPPRRRLLTRTPAFRLAGAPVTTSAVRRELAWSGHVEGGRTPRVVLLAEPLDRALVQVWSSRVQRGAPVRWRGFLQRWAGHHELPPAADPTALARQWADRVGSDRVHVVASPVDSGAATVAGVLGLPLRPGAGPVVPARWRDLSPAALDVARRVNGVLGVRVDGPRRDEAVRALVATLDPSSRSTGRATRRSTGLTVPVEHRDWCLDRAEQITEDLLAGGYPVHGRLEDLVPRFEGLPTRPPRAEVLAVAVAACLRQASRDQEQVEAR